MRRQHPRLGSGQHRAATVGGPLQEQSGVTAEDTDRITLALGQLRRM